MSMSDIYEHGQRNPRRLWRADDRNSQSLNVVEWLTERLFEHACDEAIQDYARRV